MSRARRSVFLSLLVAGTILSLAVTLPAQVGRRQGMIEPNTADEKDLMKLPHLNSALAKGIVERRPFANMMDLHKFLIQSLDNKQVSELYTKMFLPINLNTATREEIMLIPGMGNRMVREFLEYRPYTAITQFRKEIGKYVDDAEVARLEKYVFVPINLNSATDETLLSIPGLTPELLRALKDHRPYKNPQEFRAEIAKYMSANELGRLERYLTFN
jgi:DNA uptake protein ComE-like DNA-binding protein